MEMKWEHKSSKNAQPPQATVNSIQFITVFFIVIIKLIERISSLEHSNFILLPYFFHTAARRLLPEEKML